ncbi:right-handed parallel beta-helix repeat-containing protein [bacterium]|nr:right-handed parallel beta-helix repeat-containing protein [bacterium]
MKKLTILILSFLIISCSSNNNSCENSTHLEDGKCVSNIKLVDCSILNPPENSEAIIESVEIYWSNGSWSETKECDYQCDDRFILRDNRCISAIYIDPMASNNGNGTLENPYNSMKGILYNYGTSYLIKRGTILNETIEIKASGKEGESIIVTAYGSGDNPIINGGKIIDNWSYISNNIYQSKPIFEENEGVGHLVFKGDSLPFIVWNETVEKTLGGCYNKCYTTTSNGEIYLYSLDEPNPNDYVYSSRYWGIYAKNQSHIIIENLDIRNNSFHCVQFENGEDIIVQNMLIKQCGGAFLGEIQAGNGIEFGNSVKNSIMQSIEIENIFDSGVTIQTYDSNQTASGIVFKDIIVKKAGFAAIEIAVLKNGDSQNSSISDIVIDNVKLYNSGNGFSGKRYNLEGRGVKISADSNSGSINNVIIQNSIIDSSEGVGVFIFGDIQNVDILNSKIFNGTEDGLVIQSGYSPNMEINIDSMIFDNNQNGISINVVDGKSISISDSIFYKNRAIALLAINIPEIFESTHNIFANNLNTHLYIGTLLNIGTIDYNCYHKHDRMIGWISNSYNNLSDFVIESNLDQNSKDALFNLDENYNIIESGVCD